MEKLQARGEIPEDELKALELDMTGRVPKFSCLSFVSRSDRRIVDHARLVAGDTIRSYAGAARSLRQSSQGSICSRKCPDESSKGSSIRESVIFSRTHYWIGFDDYRAHFP